MITIPAPPPRPAIALAYSAPVTRSERREMVLWTEESDFHLARCRQEMDAAIAARDPQVRLLHIRLGILHGRMIQPDGRDIA